ncbi:hypothetical protein SAMN07250955_10663 [Arboricoccus pini]|uniref:Uncharacterized protein n=1 Tax=Arboricoccus pini TaxID=1963835 RepID=A0A212R6S8_9PROT|nr:hypothetical protein SAMN07250955_10663 [Arboricoccus pini]
MKTIRLDDTAIAIVRPGRVDLRRCVCVAAQPAVVRGKAHNIDALSRVTANAPQQSSQSKAA